MGIQRGTQAAHAGPSSSINPLVHKFGSLQVLDDLIRLRAADVVQHPILAYPRFDNDAGSYGYYTGKHLDAMINQAIIMLMDDGFRQVGHESRCMISNPLTNQRLANPKSINRGTSHFVRP
jgi:hypothetical protein